MSPRTKTAGKEPSAPQVLVAVMNSRRDFEIARDQHWYRIPLRAAPKRLRVAYLAFYQTKVFGPEKWAVNYYARVRRYATVRRADLLPEEEDHPRAGEWYYRVDIGPLMRLPRPIVSKRWRRITFIPTTLPKLLRAEEINDLFDESPLEDTLWYALKQAEIEAERQYYIGEGRDTYCLDFAVFCERGRIDVECDGDTWHADPERIPQDNARNNYLTSKGWAVLRFGSAQIEGELPTCIHAVKETINGLGGMSRKGTISKLFRHHDTGEPIQLELF